VKYDLLQIVGMILLVVAGQGLVRLLVDDQDLGLLRALPGGFALALAVHAVATVAGVALTGWSHGRAKALGRR
jgi:thiosulfate reductase cytochrome b subunit